MRTMEGVGKILVRIQMVSNKFALLDRASAGRNFSQFCYKIRALLTLKIDSMEDALNQDSDENDD